MVERKFSTSWRSALASPESALLDPSICQAAAPVWPAASVTVWRLIDMSRVPLAACSTLRAISLVAAFCSSTAVATLPVIWLISSIVPAIYDASVPDEILRVGTEDGWDMAERIAADEGLHVGHSTGANAYGALVLARRLAARGETGCIVAIACDRGDRYFAPRRWEKHHEW